MKLNTVTDVSIKPECLDVQPQAILNLLGYGYEADDEHINTVIEKCLSASFQVLKPQGGFLFLRKDNIILPEGKLVAGNHEFQIGKIIASQLKRAEYIALFVCSIGKSVEQLSKESMDRGDLLEGYVFDLIGSEAAEATAGFLHETIKEASIREGFNITNRFSPGYCNWSVKEQFRLFGFFPKDYAGIKLTESALMNPIKSVSGIVGIGENVKFKPYTCSMCSDQNCIYRNSIGY